MDLDAGCNKALERLESARGVLAHEAAPHIGRDGVQRYVHGAQLAGDDAVDVLIGEVGERDEVALQKTQAVVVVADVERGAHVLGQHRHKTEDAAIHAGAHAVKDRSVKLDAPVLARQALKRAGGIGCVAGVKDREVNLLGICPPEPSNHIGQGLARNLGHDHAGFQAGIPCGRIGPHGAHAPAHRLAMVGFGLGAAVGDAAARVRGSDGFCHAPTTWKMARTVRSIWSAGVEAPAVTPMSSAPSNQATASSSASSM